MVHGCRLQGGLQAARLRSGAPSGPAAIVARLEAELHKGSGGSRGICNHRSPAPTHHPRYRRRLGGSRPGGTMQQAVLGDVPGKPQTLISGPSVGILSKPMELFVGRCHRKTNNYIDLSSRPTSSPEIKVSGFPGHLRRRSPSGYGERI